MENLGFGQILLLTLFILVPLIKFVTQRVRRRLEDQIPGERSVTEMSRQVQAIPAPLKTPRASRDSLREAQEPTVATPPSRRRLAQRAFLKDRRDVRRGIIIMTLLGPCRTFDSLD
jgi:hypothetical protein